MSNRELVDQQLDACCVPLGHEPLAPDEADMLARGFKAVADPTRLRLLSLIASTPGGEACVCDLTVSFALSGPTISHHLKVLREAGLITGERRRTWVYYRAVPDVMRQLAAVLTPAVHLTTPSTGAGDD